MSQQKWDKRFLDMAKLVSTWSSYPRTKVGAVITDKKNRVISLGFNGLAQKIDDNKRFENRELGLKSVIHAEENAMIFAKQDLENCTMYIYPQQPCSQCIGPIIQSGINKIVSFEMTNERWIEDSIISTRDIELAKIDLILYKKDFEFKE